MDIKNELALSKGDVFHAGVKSAISMIPVAGGFASELFGLYVSAPAEKRKENVLIMIDNRLRELEEKVADFHTVMSERNESFVSATLQVTQIAMRTHQQDKLVALVNAITNSILDSSVDDSIQQMFLTFIDNFNEWHLRLIMFLNNPKACCTAKGISTDLRMGNISDILYRYYPELSNKKDFTKQLYADLYNRGLLNSDTTILTAMMSGSGIVAERTSEMGKQFIKFIVTPEVLL